LLARLAQRGLSLRSLAIGELAATGLGMVTKTLSRQQGIPTDTAKQLIRFLKAAKIKAQGSVQRDELRVTGTPRAGRPSATALLKGKQDEVKLDLQFVNFRD